MTPVADKLAALLAKARGTGPGATAAMLMMRHLGNAIGDEIVAVLRPSGDGPCRPPHCRECFQNDSDRHLPHCAIGALSARLGPLLEENNG
jgi:hypothetical protein